MHKTLKICIAVLALTVASIFAIFELSSVHETTVNYSAKIYPKGNFITGYSSDIKVGDKTINIGVKRGQIQTIDNSPPNSEGELCLSLNIKDYWFKYRFNSYAIVFFDINLEKITPSKLCPPHVYGELIPFGFSIDPKTNTWSPPVMQFYF